MCQAGDSRFVSARDPRRESPRHESPRRETLRRETPRRETPRPEAREPEVRGPRPRRERPVTAQGLCHTRSRCAFLSSVNSSNLGQKERWFSGCRVRMWRVVVAMEQRDSTCHAFGPRYSTGTEGGRGNERTGGSLQLRKGAVHVDTDLAVALLDFAFSPGSQVARRATPDIPRSQVACGALKPARSPPLVAFGLFSYHRKPPRLVSDAVG